MRPGAAMQSRYVTGVRPRSLRWLTAAALAVAVTAPVFGADQAALSTAPGAHEITCATPRALRAYQAGLRLFHLDRAPEAAAQFADAIKRDPACAMAQWGLSRALQKQGKTAEAEAALSAAEAAALDVDDRE